MEPPPHSPGLRLRPLRLGDEPEMLAAQAELAADGFAFLLGYQPGESWAHYLRMMGDRQRGLGLLPHWVASSFLVAEHDGTIVGRASIRHELNDRLLRGGGHIGYAVRPAHRRRGHATEILRQALIVARALGVEAALVVCAHDNLASAAVIERCGGVLEGIAEDDDGQLNRRYWIA